MSAGDSLEGGPGLDSALPPHLQSRFRQWVVSPGVVLLVLAVVVSSVPLSRDLLLQASHMRLASVAYAHGDDARAASLWQAVIDARSRVPEASSGMACALWKLGYQDHALLMFHDAVGLSDPGSLPRRVDCFYTNLPAHHLFVVLLGTMERVLIPQAADQGYGLLHDVVVSNSRGNQQGYLTAIALNTAPDIGQRLLAAACLADRAKLKLLAATYLNLAFIGTVNAAGELRQCLYDMVNGYQTARVGGREVFQPKDRTHRLYVPGASAVPAPVTLARTLP